MTELKKFKKHQAFETNGYGVLLDLIFLKSPNFRAHHLTPTFNSQFPVFIITENILCQLKYLYPYLLKC